MGEFNADWLGLREPADAAARSADLAAAVAEHLRWRPLPRLCVDLGTGTGSNVRYLAQRLPAPHDWRLIDRDPQLLEQLLPRLSAWALALGAELSGDRTWLSIQKAGLSCRVEARRADLARLLFGRFPRAARAKAVVDASTPVERSKEGHDLFADAALVTASAFLDLVSAAWIDELADRCARAGAAVLFALTYDGRWSCTPEDADDEVVRALVNRHQHTVKGFGKALGPDAVAHAVTAFRSRDYEVLTDASDWRLGSTHAPLQQELVDGWARAAVAVDGSAAPRIEEWRTRRQSAIAESASELVVGHVDLAGWPRTGAPAPKTF